MDSLEVQLMDAIRNGKVDVVQSLLNKGCKVDVGDVDNLTPLHLAAMRDHQEIARLLIDNGASVNRKTADKMTPLHYAAVRGLVEMVSLLLNGGAHVDPLDANDRTPLMLAVTRDHPDVVETLIKYKAKINIEEIHGYTPLCEAVWNKSVEIASLLLKSGAKLTQSQHLLHYTVLHRHLAMAELLLQYGAYPNLRDDHGDTPLILAISCCHIDMIRLLLQYDASPICFNSISGITPVHQAMNSATTRAMFDEILRLLCMHNLDLNAASLGLMLNPLSYAVSCGKVDCAVSLIRAGVDVNKALNSLVYEPLKFLNKDLDDKKYGAKFCCLAYFLVSAGYNMSRYKVECPKDFSKLNIESIDGWLTYMKFNPRRLADLCRLNIRSQMGNKVLQLVPLLEIPQSLKQFLLFEDVLIK